MDDDLRYDDCFDADAIRQASAQTHAFWGRGRDLPAHVRRNFVQIGASEGQCRYVGLRDPAGAVVSSLKWYDLRFRGRPGEARAFGVGAVFTPDEYRGQGYATRLLRAAMEEAARQGYGLAMLYSDIEPAFYARLGYFRFSAVDWEIPASALPAAEPLQTRHSVASDEAALIEFHESHFGEEWLWPRRPPKLWRYLRRRNEAAGDLILTEGGRSVGYLNVRAQAGRLQVEELAAPSALHDRVWATVRQIATARGLASVAGWERPDQTPAGASRTQRPDCIPMLAALQPDNPWAAFLEEAAGENRAFFGALDHF